jgi:uncharacterized protein YjbI with pentapeptide repeats
MRTLTVEEIKEKIEKHAFLQGADLQGTNLQGADLQGANLQGANIDYSYLPLRCGGLEWEIDEHTAAQLIYHVCSMKCGSMKFIALRNTMLDFANEFHRVGHDCPKL